MRPLLFAAALFLALVQPAAAEWTEGPGYKTFVIGNEAAPTPGPVTGGLLMSGGGDWAYDAFRWFTAKAGHGHLVVLRASGTTESQDEFYNVVGGLASVRTFLFLDREAAYDPQLLDAVRKADAIFLAGGDQANYVRMWQGTPLNEAIDAHVAANKPLGGTSAGLAVQGAWLYGALDGGSITSPEALADPLGDAVTLANDFFHFALLDHVITDSHFDERGRQGRLIAFLVKADYVRGSHQRPTLVGLGVDEEAALTVEADGTAKVHSNKNGHVWLFQGGEVTDLAPGRPLTMTGITATGIGTASGFNVKTLEIKDPAFVRTYDVKDGALNQRP